MGGFAIITLLDELKQTSGEKNLLGLIINLMEQFTSIFGNLTPFDQKIVCNIVLTLCFLIDHMSAANIISLEEKVLTTTKLEKMREEIPKISTAATVFQVSMLATIINLSKK